MFLVTTPTGNSGRHVLSSLLASAADVRVRVLVRDAKKLDPASRARCEIVEGDLRSEEAIAQAARGVRAAFFCIPLQSREPLPVAAYHRSFVDPVARAFAAAGVERVVTISGGRGSVEDPGPNGPLARMERTFDESVPGTRHVRCGYFMENFLHLVPLLKFKGAFGFPLPPSYPLALEWGGDIGEEAARWLLDPTWSGHAGVTVAGGEVLSCAEIAVTMSRVLGKTIRYEPMPAAEYKAMLMKSGGLSEAMAQSVRELFEDADHGTLSGKTAVKAGGLHFESWAEAELKPAMCLPAVLKRILR